MTLVLTMKRQIIMVLVVRVFVLVVACDTKVIVYEETPKRVVVTYFVLFVMSEKIG